MNRKMNQEEAFSLVKNMCNLEKMVWEIDEELRRRNYFMLEDQILEIMDEEARKADKSIINAMNEIENE